MNVTMTMPRAAALAVAAMLVCARVAAQDAASFAPEQIAKGAAIYERTCAPCHGSKMKDPESAFNLRKFPPEQRERFNTSVTRGKNQMPPWGDMLLPGDIDSLWAYVMAGDR